MKHYVLGAALVAALATAPAIAKEKKAMTGEATQTTQSHADYNTDTMLKNKDGSLQGKPVVQGPADWSHVRLDSSASSGASSGESGSASKASGSESSR
jgi:hypothetical protein